MIKCFRDNEPRKSGLVYRSVLEQIKKMHAVDPEKAGELAISAIELILTDEISSDDVFIDMLLTTTKAVNDDKVSKYEQKIETTKTKKMVENKLEEIAKLMRENYTQAQIGVMLGISQQAVSKRVKTIKSEFPQLLQPEMVVESCTTKNTTVQPKMVVSSSTTKNTTLQPNEVVQSCTNKNGCEEVVQPKMVVKNGCDTTKIQPDTTVVQPILDNYNLTTCTTEYKVVQNENGCILDENPEYNQKVDFYNHTRLYKDNQNYNYNYNYNKGTSCVEADASSTDSSLVASPQVVGANGFVF